MLTITKATQGTGASDGELHVTEPQTYPDAPPLLLTVPQAAKALLVSRAGLAQLIWNGQLAQTGDGTFLAETVQELAERRRQSASERGGALQGWVQHRLVWLLHDWGGTGRVGDLSRALRTSRSSLSHRLAAMSGPDGYVSAGPDGWRLTERGWAYTRQVDPPVL